VLETKSGHSRKLPLDLAVHRALKAHEQLLVEHGSDPLKRRQLRYVGPLLKPRNRAVGSTRRLGDLLLGEPQLETTLPQMGRYGADLTKGANTLVFGAGIAVCRVTVSAALGCLGSTLTNGAV
jgi:hypothetical protein